MGLADRFLRDYRWQETQFGGSRKDSDKCCPQV
jgi:hypothetical protein